MESSYKEAEDLLQSFGIPASSLSIAQTVDLLHTCNKTHANAVQGSEKRPAPRRQTAAVDLCMCTSRKTCVEGLQIPADDLADQEVCMLLVCLNILNTYSYEQLFLVLSRFSRRTSQRNFPHHATWIVKRGVREHAYELASPGLHGQYYSFAQIPACPVVNPVDMRRKGRRNTLEQAAHGSTGYWLSHPFPHSDASDALV